MLDSCHHGWKNRKPSWKRAMSRSMQLGLSRTQMKDDDTIEADGMGTIGLMLGLMTWMKCVLGLPSSGMH